MDNNVMFQNALTTKQPNVNNTIPLDITPSMTPEQRQTALDLEAQGYDYTKTARAYNEQITKEADTRNSFYDSLSYNQRLGVAQAIKDGANEDNILNAFQTNKQTAQIFEKLGSDLKQKNDMLFEQSQDGFLGATTKAGRNASQLRTLAAMAEKQYGLDTPEKKLAFAKMVNEDLGEDIKLDENGRMFTLGADGNTKIDIEPGFVSTIQTNAATLLSGVIAGTSYITKAAGERLGLKILTDFYRQGIKNRMIAGSKFGLYTGIMGGLPDLLFNADNVVANYIYLDKEYQKSGQKILSSNYDNRFKEFGKNVAFDTIGSAVLPEVFRGAAKSVEGLSNVSRTAADILTNFPDRVKNSFVKGKGLFNNTDKQLDEYGLKETIKRKVKRTIQPMSKNAEELNETIADTILAKRKAKANVTMNKLEQTEAFLKESGWSTEDLNSLSKLDKLILTNMGNKATADSMIEQMSWLIGLDDIAKVRKQGEIIARTQLDSIIEFSNAVQNADLSITNILSNLGDFGQQTKNVMNAIAKKYETSILSMSPLKLGENLKPALIKLAKINSIYDVNAQSVGLNKYSLFDEGKTGDEFSNLLEAYGLTSSSKAQNKLIRRTLKYGLDNQKTALTAQNLQTNIDNVSLDDFLKTLVDLEQNKNKLTQAGVKNIDSLIENMRFQLAEQTDAFPNILMDYVTINKAATEAKKIGMLFSNNTAIGKIFNNVRAAQTLDVLPQLTDAAISLSARGESPNLSLLAKAAGITPEDLELNFLRELTHKKIAYDANKEISFDHVKNIVKAFANNINKFETKAGKYVAKQLTDMINYNANFLENLGKLHSRQKSHPTAFLAKSLQGRLQMFFVSRQWLIGMNLMNRLMSTDATVMKYTASKAANLLATGRAKPTISIQRFKDNLGKILAEPKKQENINIAKQAMTDMVNNNQMTDKEAVDLMKRFGNLISEVQTAENQLAKVNGYEGADDILLMNMTDKELNDYLLDVNSAQ